MITIFHIIPRAGRITGDATIDRDMDAAPVPGSSALLTRLSRVVYRRAEEARLGMRLKEYMSLQYLRGHLEHGDQGPLQQVFAEAMHLDANNCVLLLNELEAHGYVHRIRDIADRRRHVITITPSGTRALDKAERYMATVEDEVLGALTVEERTTLRELLSRALEGERAHHHA
jgi:DNA-binding MarR family transcriptional regulator